MRCPPRGGLAKGVALPDSAVLAERWALKRVQGDDEGRECAAGAAGLKPVRTGCTGPWMSRKTAFLHYTFRATAAVMISAPSFLPCIERTAQAPVFYPLDTVTSVTASVTLAGIPARITSGAAA